jgi:hypothetical protein
MMMIVKTHPAQDVKEEIRKTHPDFAIKSDYGYQGRVYFYATVNLTDREYTLFLLRWGEYFAV